MVGPLEPVEEDMQAVQVGGTESAAADKEPAHLENVVLEVVVVGNAEVSESSVEVLLEVGRTEVHYCRYTAGWPVVEIVDQVTRPLAIGDATGAHGFGVSMAEVGHCEASEAAVLGDMAKDWSRGRHCSLKSKIVGT